MKSSWEAEAQGCLKLDECIAEECRSRYVDATSKGASAENCSNIKSGDRKRRVCMQSTQHEVETKEHFL